MLDKSRTITNDGKLEQVVISGLATAVPDHCFSQSDALDRACHFIPKHASLAKVFERTGVERRYSCVPMEWYRTSRGWKESNAAYIEQALILLEKVAGSALNDAGLTPPEISAIVLVSSTGLAIPSLEALLCNKMGFAPTVQRTPIFGLGCAGGATGLARAKQLAGALPGSNILFLVVELAGLNVSLDANNPALFVSAALFGDGAGAVVLHNSGGSESGPANALLYNRPRIGETGEFMWRDSEEIMGWDIEDDGLNVILSNALPSFTQRELLPVVEGFLRQHQLGLDDLDGFITHPGGPRVMDAIERALSLKPDALRHSRSTLRDYGNMSAPTVLFVLQRALADGSRGRHLMMSFGPAFTVTFVVLYL